MSPGPDAAIVDRLRNVRGFALDLDGTVWEGPRLLPGAREVVADWRGAGLAVIFASNSSRHGSAVLLGRLRELGIEAPPRAMLAALDLSGEVVARHMGRARVLAVGTEDLDEILQERGHTIVRAPDWKSAQAVVVGIDPDFNYDLLRAAARAVAAGAAFFAVNMDASFPVGPGEFDPGSGSLAEAIGTAAGARPIGIGKPERSFFQVVAERLACGPEHAAMVGDSIASDMTGGHSAGMFTVWLNADHQGPLPECVDLRVPDLHELRRLWRLAQASR